MLHEFDQYLDKCYLVKKARKDRWYWNNSIKIGRAPAKVENPQWKPAVAYWRYGDDFVITVKGNKNEAEAIREQCRVFLEGKLRLTLNMEKARITIPFAFQAATLLQGGLGVGHVLPVHSLPSPPCASSQLEMLWVYILVIIQNACIVAQKGSSYVL